MQERLQKILARCGVGSRRECEGIIEQGRVAINGAIVTKLGTKVDPGEDKILVDGEPVKPEDRVYYLLNKPKGFLCTNSDDFGRQKVIDLIPDHRRIYTVGRLDEGSEGLILLTNDGKLANIICHPRYQVDKTYRLTVPGPVQPAQLERIERGVWLSEGKTAPAQIRRVDRRGNRTIVTVTIWEGRNRELRRIFAKVDLRVSHLLRTAIGPLTIDGLETGSYRRLTEKELAFARERMAEGWKPRPAKPAGRPAKRGRADVSTGKPARGPRGPGGPRPSRGPRPPRGPGGPP